MEWKIRDTRLQLVWDEETEPLNLNEKEQKVHGSWSFPRIKPASPHAFVCPLPILMV